MSLTPSRRSPFMPILLAMALSMAGCSKPEPSPPATSSSAKPTPIVPENGLEASLLQAAANPTARLSFEREFLASDVFLRTDPARIPEVQAAIGPDGKLVRRADIYFWAFRDEQGNIVVPVFTSAARLRSVYPGKAWVRLKGRQVLRMVGDRPLVVNRSLSPEVAWTPSDIRAIRDGEGPSAN